MNYTENYHLPQWVKDDRIMMEDFNAAMAGIERAFTDSTAEIKQNQSAAENEDALVWNAVTRCARRLLAGQMDLSDKTRITCVNGTLCHPLTSSELAGTLNGGKWHERLGVFAGRGEEMTGVNLKSKSISFQGGMLGLSASNANAHSHYEFTAPVTGVIRSFTLFTRISSVTAGGDPHLYRPVQLTAKRKVAGSYSRVVYQKDLVLDKIFTQMTTYEDEIEVEIPITKGGSYYLELTISGSTDVYGRYGFVSEIVRNDDLLAETQWIDNSQFRIYDLPVESVTVTRTMPTEGPATRAVAIARYRKDGPSPKVGITLNGKSMHGEATYERTDRDGGPYTEIWYTYQDKALTGDLTIQTTLTCDGAEEARLLEYGVMLI